MLRVYFLQQWLALSDPAVEDALYEWPVLRRFAGIDLGRAPAPDATTVLNFRHLLEAQEPDQGPGAGQGGVAVSHPQARLRLYPGALSRVEEEPRVAMRGLCLGQHLPAPPQAGQDQFTDGPTGGVVCSPGLLGATGG